jgi:RNA polymerase sigma-70 factor (ECF subfamily)
MNKQLTERLWNEFRPELRLFILKSVRNETDAEDLLQEVFIKVFLKSDSISDPAKTRAWLYQVTRNVIHDFRRKQKTGIAARDLEGLLHDDTSLRDKLLDCLPSLMEQLPAQYREVLGKTTLEEVSQKELATRLQISYSGVKSRVQRARVLLQDLLRSCCKIGVDRLGRISSLEPRAYCRCHTC